MQVFRNLLTEKEEDSFDEFPATLKIFFEYISHRNGAEIAANFAGTLLNFFKASTPSVRYVAATSLQVLSTVYPNTVKGSTALVYELIMGCLDEDHMIAQVSASVLECFYLPEPARAALKSYRTQNGSAADYQALYCLTLAQSQSAQPLYEHMVARQSILQAPPVPLALVHRLLNGIKFLPKEKIVKQIRILSVMVTKLERIDSVAIRSIIGLMEDPDNELMLVILECLHGLSSSLKNASWQDLESIWHCVQRTLLLGECRESVWERAFAVVRIFPWSNIDQSVRSELMTGMVSLIYHPNRVARTLFYNYLGEVADQLISAGVGSQAVAILVLAIGEHDTVAFTKVCAVSERYPSCKKIIAALTALKEMRSTGDVKYSRSRNPEMKLVAIFDELASQFAKDASEWRLVTDILLSAPWQHKIQDYYLGADIEQLLVQSDEYDYAHNYVQEPFWSALLYFRLNAKLSVAVSLH